MSLRRSIRRLQRLRELREQQARSAVANAQLALTAAAAASAASLAAYRQRSAPGSSLPPSQLVAWQLRGAGALERAQTDAAAVDDAEAELARREEARVAASVARRSLDRLVERIEDREAVAAAQAAQREADETALLLRGGPR